MTPDLNHRAAEALARLVEQGRIESPLLHRMASLRAGGIVYPSVPDLSDPLTVQALVLLLGDALPGWCWLAPSFDLGVGQWAVWHWTGETAPTILGHGMLPRDAVVMALEAATAPEDGRETPPTRGG